MAVAAEDSFIDIRNVVHDSLHEQEILVRVCVAGSVGNVDDGGSGFDDFFDYFVYIIKVGSS